MLENNLISLNISSLGSQNLLNAQAGQMGLGLGSLAQINPLADFNLDLHRVAEALPYIGLTAVGIAAVGAASFYAVRLWRGHQASLPPPGMKDIRPAQMQAFFDRHAADKPEVTSVLMGFSSTALQETLEEAAQRIDSEKRELERTLEAAKDEKSRKIIEGFLSACVELGSLSSLRRGETTRASEQWIEKPEQAYASVVQRLSHLRRYRVDTMDRFLRDAYPHRRTEMPEIETDPGIAARYVSLDKKQKAQMFGLAVTVWQSLSVEQKEFFWDLLRPTDPARGVMLPPDFMTLFVHLMPKPSFPLKTKELETHLPALIARRIDAMNRGPELPAFFQDANNSMVFFRDGDTRAIGNVRILRRLGKAQVVVEHDVMKKVTNANGAEELQRTTVREPFAPEQILTIRHANHVSPKAQQQLTHASVTLNDANGRNVPGMVIDMKEYPAYSLGEKHRVLVDYMDPKLIQFFGSIESLYKKIGQLEEKHRDPLNIAESLWRSLQTKLCGQTNPERLELRSGPGHTHSLMDVVQATGEVEFAILMQMVFQYMGIPSRLEQGEVKMLFSRGRTDLDPGGPVKTLWVRVMVPGHRQRIFCGRLNDPLLEDHPAFASFSDQGQNSGPHSAPGPISGTEDTVMAPIPGESTSSVFPPSASVAPPSGVVARVAEPEEELAIDEDIQMIPDSVAPPAADENPTKLFPVSDLGAGASQGPTEASGPHEQNTVVAINPLHIHAMEQGLDAELPERYPIFADGSPTALHFIEKLRGQVIKAWRNEGQPALETDESGLPTVMPERFIEKAVGAWLTGLQHNSSEVAQQILDKWVDAGDRAARRLAREEAVALASLASQSSPAPRQTPPPLPKAEGSEPRRAMPPPAPVANIEEAARAAAERRDAELVEEAEDALVARYPFLREPSERAWSMSLSKKMHKAAAGDSSKFPELAEHYMGLLLPKIENDPAHENRIRSIRAADSMMQELKERYPAFQKADWGPLAIEALGEIFHHWQIEHSPLEEFARGEYVIPERLFEEGFANFTSKLTTRHPDTDPEVFHQAFIDGDEGPRDRRWLSPEPEEEIAETPVPAAGVTDVSSVREKVVGRTTEAVVSRIKALYPAMEGRDAALQSLAGKVLRKETDPDFNLDAAIHGIMGALIRTLSDSARVGTPLEDQLKSLIETDVAAELRERYRVFRDPKFSSAVSKLAKRIYDIWTSHNRTFNGTVNVLPLRVPEKFVNEAMEALINQLRRKDPSMAGEIVGSFTGYRAERAASEGTPSTPPLSSSIPISETTILVEIRDRFRQFSMEYPDLARALSKTIYKTWLKEDPTRDGEKNSMGRRGLVPEVYLERCRKDLYDRLTERGLKEVRDAMSVDRGPRNKRGTQLVEFDIQEEVARRAG